MAKFLFFSDNNHCLLQIRFGCANRRQKNKAALVRNAIIIHIANNQICNNNIADVDECESTIKLLDICVYLKYRG